MTSFNSVVAFLLCLFIRPIPSLSDRQVVPSWKVELHYQYLVETEIGLLKRETMDMIEKLSLEGVFFRIGKEVYVDNVNTPFHISEVDSLPLDKIRNSGNELCTAQNESTNECFIVDGAMTIKVHGQTAHDASLSFYKVLEKTLNDQLTFSSILPESSIVFYITSMEEKNSIRSENKRPNNPVAVLVTFMVGGCIFVVTTLMFLFCSERPRKVSKKINKNVGGRLGISQASPYWLEMNSTSSSLSFESTILPSNVLDSMSSSSSSSISDLSGGSNQCICMQLEKIEEVEDKNALDYYPDYQSSFNNKYFSLRGEI